MKRKDEFKKIDIKIVHIILMIYSVNIQFDKKLYKNIL